MNNNNKILLNMIKKVINNNIVFYDKIKNKEYNKIKSIQVIIPDISYIDVLNFQFKKNKINILFFYSYLIIKFCINIFLIIKYFSIIKLNLLVCFLIFDSFEFIFQIIYLKIIFIFIKDPEIDNNKCKLTIFSIISLIYILFSFFVNGFSIFIIYYIINITNKGQIENYSDINYFLLIISIIKILIFMKGILSSILQKYSFDNYLLKRIKKLLNSKTFNEIINEINIELEKNKIVIDKNVILNTFYYKDKEKHNFTNKTCCICKEEYKKLKRVTVFNCNHDFHERCISKWIKNKPTCPLCRRNLNSCINI